SVTGTADQRLAWGVAEQVDEVLEIARVGTLGGLGEAVISADERAHAALAKLGVDSAAVVDDPLHADLDGELPRETPGLPLVERAPNDADGRADKDPILHRLQHVQSLIVRGLAMIDHVDAAAHGALDRLRRPAVRADPLAEVPRDLHCRADFALAH